MQWSTDFRFFAFECLLLEASLLDHRQEHVPKCQINHFSRIYGSF